MRQGSSATIAQMPSALEARTRIVQSSANRWVKALRAALTHPPALARRSDAAAPLLALEGFHLVRAALGSGLIPAALFLRDGSQAEALATLEEALASSARSNDRSATMERLLQETEILVLPPALFAGLLATETPQPVAALVGAPPFSSEEIVGGPLPLVAVLAGLQDPGNVGTLLRSAEAFGATGALLLPATATPWNPKCLRASAGSALRLPMLALESAGDAATLLRANRIRSYAAVPIGGSVPDALDLRKPVALWIGNEGAGLSAAELALCENRITISMPGAIESLNAAVAGSVLFYEVARQHVAMQGA